MQLEHSQKDASRKKAFFKYPPPPASSLENEHNTLAPRGASFSHRRTVPFFTLAAPLPACSSCCQRKRLRKSKPLLGCTFPLPHVKAPETLRCTPYFQSPLHLPLSSLHLQASSWAQLFPGKAGREIGSSTSSRSLNFLFSSANVNPHTSERQPRFLLQPGRCAYQLRALLLHCAGVEPVSTSRPESTVPAEKCSRLLPLPKHAWPLHFPSQR